MSEEVTCGKLDFGKALSDAFKLLKENFVLVVVSTLVAQLMSVCCFLLVGAMMMGMFAICDRLVTGDETKPEIGDLFKGFSLFLPGFVLVLLGAIGTVACYIGAFITVPIAVLGMFRIIDKGVTIGEAIKFGCETIFKQGQWMFILLTIVASIISSLGAIACGIGAIVTAPLFYLILACGYRQICPKA